MVKYTTPQTEEEDYFTTVRIRKSVLKQMEVLKIHPRQTYDELIVSLLAKNK